MKLTIVLLLVIFSRISLGLDFISPNPKMNILTTSAYDNRYPIKINVTISEIEYNKTLNISLARDLNIIAIKKKFYFEGQISHWIGTITNDPYGLIVITYTETHLSINLHTGGKQYSSIKKNGTYYIVENIRAKELTQDRSDAVSLNLPQSKTLIPSKSSDQFIDLMIAYTPAASIEAGGDTAIEVDIASRVTALNQHLANSCVNYRYRLVHTEKVTYTEQATMQPDLDELYSGASFGADSLAQLQSLRDTHGADLVQMITSGDSNYCGLAHTNAPGDYNDVKSVSVTRYECGVLTMSHELGHNVGLQHDLYQTRDDTRRGDYDDGFGFVDLVNKTRSIMSYNDQCSDQGFFCDRVSHFSNPKKINDGVPFGIGGSANAVNFLNNNYAYPANFRVSRSNFSPDIEENCIAESDNKDIHCFIATAAFGTYMQDDVIVLRNFRDGFLKSFSLGREAIKFYYSHSPRLALKVRNNLILKKISRTLIKMVSSIINFPMLSLLSLSLLTGLIFFVSKKVIFYITIAVIFGFSIQTARADIAVPSIFSNKISVNPATRLLNNVPVMASLDYQIREEKSDGGSVEQEKKGNIINFTLGSYTPQFFFEGTIFSRDKGSVIDKNDLIKDVENETKKEQLRLQIGSVFNLIGSIGFKYHSIKTSDDKGFFDNEKSILGIGRVGTLLGYRYGIGLDYISEKGDSTPETKWIETYASIAGGTYSGAAGYSLEYSLRRSPKVTKSDGTNVNFHGEKLSHQLTYETADVVFSALAITKLRVSYFLSTEDAVSPYSEKETTTVIGLAFGGPITSIRTDYMIGYNLSTRDNGIKTSGSKIDLNLTWKI